ncbi:MAG: WecB/TagA/CpsF family glycosyltransferase [Anaerolineales bacterium]|nr:WecB/TagA/CpsF family glycosyltransferase [Anaerolineales bacterium]
MRRLIVILGVPIDDLNMTETLDRLEEFVRVGRATGKGHQIATVNADFVVKSMTDPELRYLLQEADLATADGMPLVWGARLLGVDLEGRVAGADMIPALAQRAAEKGYSIYFLGAAPGIAAQAAEILKEQYPGLIVAGVHSPPYSSVIDMDPAIIAEIKAARPDILLVAFGNPKQEKWIGMYGRDLGIPVMIGVGGTLDFITGNTKRAPEWMQRFGLEWLHRLLMEPRRLWRRYAVDMVGFGTFFLRQWWVMRRGNQPTPVLPKTDLVIVNETAVLNVEGHLTVSNYDGFNQTAQEALTVTPYLLVNLADAVFLDSSVIGSLVGLTKQARDAGGELWLAAVPPTIMQTLALLRLDRFFVIVDDTNSGLAQRQAHAQESTGSGSAGFEVITPPATRPDSAVPVMEAAWAVLKGPRRLDATTAPEMAETCAALLDDNPRVVLDLSETVLLASAGLAALAQINRLANERNGQLRVANCSKDVLRVIEMVRFDKVLALYSDVPAAMA